MVWISMANCASRLHRSAQHTSFEFQKQCSWRGICSTLVGPRFRHAPHHLSEPHDSRWGKIPLLLLDQLELRTGATAFVGTEDWFMFPLLAAGIAADYRRHARKISTGGW